MDTVLRRKKKKRKNLFIRTHLWPRKMPHRSKSKRNRRVHVCPRNVSNWVNQHCHYEPCCYWSCKLWHSALVNNTETSRTTSHEHQKKCPYNLRKHLPHHRIYIHFQQPNQNISLCVLCFRICVPLCRLCTYID